MYMGPFLLFLAFFALTGDGLGQTKKNPPRQPAPSKTVKPGATVKPPKPTAPPQYPVLSLKVEGLQNYSEAQVLAVAGVKVGDVATKELFEEARKRLLATGLFEQTGYKYAPTRDKKGYAAVISVVEVQPLYPVRFEDLPATNEELLEALRQANPLFGPLAPGTRQALDQYVNVIQTFLERTNRKQEVNGSVAADENGKLVALFRPKRQPPSIAEVHFTGNTAIPTPVLQNAIAGVAIGAPYKEANFRRLLDYSVRPVYEARGMLRVEFPNIETSEAVGAKGVAVRVTVSEGPVYKLGYVTVQGAPVDPKAFSKISGFKRGEVFNLTAVEEGREQVMRLVRRAGYMNAKSEWLRKIDDAARTVDLTLNVDPGPQFSFGHLTIVGLDIVTEPEIRRLWALKAGQPFNADYPDYFLQRIREDGILDNLGKTKSQIQVNEDSRTVDVTLSFQGEPSREIRRRKRP